MHIACDEKRFEATKALVELGAHLDGKQRLVVVVDAVLLALWLLLPVSDKNGVVVIVTNFFFLMVVADADGFTPGLCCVERRT